MVRKMILQIHVYFYAYTFTEVKFILLSMYTLLITFLYVMLNTCNLSHVFFFTGKLYEWFNSCVLNSEIQTACFKIC